jgi:hypothetical protein
MSFPTSPKLLFLGGIEGTGICGEGGMSLFPVGHGSRPGEPTSMRIWVLVGVPDKPLIFSRGTSVMSIATDALGRPCPLSDVERILLLVLLEL